MAENSEWVQSWLLIKGQQVGGAGENRRERRRGKRRKKIIGSLSSDVVRLFLAKLWEASRGGEESLCGLEGVGVVKKGPAVESIYPFLASKSTHRLPRSILPGTSYQVVIHSFWDPAPLTYGERGSLALKLEEIQINVP